MRCHICDRVLGEGEISFNKDHDDFDPCGVCLDVINDVFSNKTEEEIDEELLYEFPELSETCEISLDKPEEVWYNTL